MTNEQKRISHAAPTGAEEISNRLRDAIDGLRRDVTRVEVWAAALGAFAKPVPDYRPDSTHDLKTSEDPSAANPYARKTPEPGA